MNAVNAKLIKEAIQKTKKPKLNDDKSKGPKSKKDKKKVAEKQAVKQEASAEPEVLTEKEA